MISESESESKQFIFYFFYVCLGVYHLSINLIIEGLNLFPLQYSSNFKVSVFFVIFNF